MAKNGLGISDAVRGAVSSWMTDRLIDRLYEEYRHQVSATAKSSFGVRLRNSEQWVRIKRLRWGAGWKRTYYSKLFGAREVTLDVQSNEADTHIQYVKVFYKNQLVGGGRVNVPSVNVSQAGRNASLVIAFEEFGEEMMKRLQAQLEYGEDAVFAVLFEPRYV